MNGTLLLSIAGASVLGSVHCAAMCGPFVGFYSGAAPPSKHLEHAAYNLGRLATYVTLGVAAGALGAALDLAGEAAGLGRVAGAVAGAIMLSWGAVLLLEASGIRAMRPRNRGRAYRWLAKRLSPVSRLPTPLRAGLLGLASGLLPCGWLYTFVVAAAGTGSGLGGAAVMAAFWAGTVPMLLGVGVGVSLLGQRLRRHVPVLSACVLLVMGTAGVIGRLNVAASSAQAATSGLEPACHRH
jgi:hypothetical protein